MRGRQRSAMNGQRPARPKEIAMASNIQPYGPPINDALDNPKTRLEVLVALRERAVATLKAQDGLKTALRRLEKEIDRRRKATAGSNTAKAKKRAEKK
jgi:hypothetical protein